MGLFARDDEAAGPVPVEAGTRREARMFERERQGERPGDTGAASAFIGKGSRITGKIVFEGPARIEGEVEGEIDAHGPLVIGEGAVVGAKISGTSIVVHGRVTGDLVARERVEIRAPSQVLGNVTTPSLVVHEGAVFEGRCSMGKGHGERPEARKRSDDAAPPRAAGPAPAS